MFCYGRTKVLRYRVVLPVSCLPLVLLLSRATVDAACRLGSAGP